MKPKLLLGWTSGYPFHEGIVPLIPRLAAEYDVYVFLVEFYALGVTLDILQSMSDRGEIKSYWLFPDTRTVSD